MVPGTGLTVVVGDPGLGVQLLPDPDAPGGMSGQVLRCAAHGGWACLHVPWRSRHSHSDLSCRQLPAGARPRPACRQPARLCAAAAPLPQPKPCIPLSCPLPRPSRPAGNRPSMSPEMFLERKVFPGTDAYALGYLLMEWLYGTALNTRA